MHIRIKGHIKNLLLPCLCFSLPAGFLSALAVTAFKLAAEFTVNLSIGIYSAVRENPIFLPLLLLGAVEALSGGGNILALILTTTVALMAVEVSGLEDFTGTLIESKMHSISKGKKPIAVSVPLTVAKDSFVIGKEIRDVLWPNSCVVISFERASGNHESAGISESDVITVRYLTHNPSVSADEFKALVGEQSDEINVIMDPEYTSKQSAD